MKFFKFNASGNDFIFFLANNHLKNKNFSSLALMLCNRQSGIGADGLVAIFKGEEENHIIWDFYNCDGSSAQMCGNASRAAGLFACEQGLVDANKSIFLHTKAGIVEAIVNKASKCFYLEDCDNLPNFFGKQAEVAVKLSKKEKLSEEFNENGYLWYFYDTGVPHLVTFVNNINDCDMQLAAKMRSKYNANVNFCELKNDEIFIRTFERGVEAETLACGTGMCAAALANREKNHITSGLKTILRPKSLEKIIVFLQGQALYFQGNVNSLFSVEI